MSDAPAITSAEVVLPCADLDATLAFFEQLGFRVEAIFPAEGPRVVVIVGHGARIRLDRGAAGAPGMVRVLCADPSTVARGLEGGASFDAGVLSFVAPNGTRVDLVAADPPLEVPPLVPSLVITHAGRDGAWGTGRAGMRYRDLIPDRQGGRFVASHIWIPEGGPVPDYVHHHKVRFQMIFCHRGWVRVAYEDQGPPIVMQAGDCVLQPPHIRHRVLEASPDMKVVELGCPAEHETRADPATTLPTGMPRPDRDFSGQRFVFHVAAQATWHPWRQPGWEARDTGIGNATRGLAGARVARPTAPAAKSDAPLRPHQGELLFGFVLEGRVTLACAGRAPEPLATGDAFVIPAGLACALTDPSADAQLLDVTLPAALPLL